MLDVYVQEVFLEYLRRTKHRIDFDFCTGIPVYHEIENEDEKLQYREDYVEQCIKDGIFMWEKMNFSNDLTVIFESLYSSYKKNEDKIVENTLQVSSFDLYQYSWFCMEDREQCTLSRYIWKTDQIDVKTLFREIILSDIGGNTDLCSSVFIIDNKTEEVFILHDDRCGDLYYGEKI